MEYFRPTYDKLLGFLLMQFFPKYCTATPPPPDLDQPIQMDTMEDSEKDVGILTRMNNSVT